MCRSFLVWIAFIPLLALVVPNSSRGSGSESETLAHWAFEEPEGPRCADASGRGNHATLTAPHAGMIRVRGIRGQAIQLRGTHALPAVLRGLGESRKALGISAWVRPAELSGFREILRHEGSHRVLFSFQEGGTVLSLGLDIGGYVECDARLDAASVQDGQWHHCAASFDGAWMRVFFDGREIGSLHRPGEIAFAPEPTAFIGSNNGTSEHFQGALDDVRLMGQALDLAGVARMHREGTNALAEFAREMEEAIRALYPVGTDFAEVLSVARHRLAAIPPDRRADLALAVQARLRREFPAEVANFATWTRTQPAEFLGDPTPGLAGRLAGRLVDLALEYRPLTDAQWQRQSPTEVRRWRELDGLRERQARLGARGSDADFAPEWIALALEAGSRVSFRPATHEPVAPYVTPATPPTRSLSSDEARAVVERDWQHQAGGQPTAERVRQEIHWARQLAERLRGGADGPDFSREEGRSMLSNADWTRLAGRRPNSTSRSAG